MSPTFTRVPDISESGYREMSALASKGDESLIHDLALTLNQFSARHASRIS